METVRFFRKHQWSTGPDEDQSWHLAYVMLSFADRSVPRLTVTFLAYGWQWHS